MNDRKPDSGQAASVSRATESLRRILYGFSRSKSLGLVVSLFPLRTPLFFYVSHFVDVSSRSFGEPLARHHARSGFRSSLLRCNLPRANLFGHGGPEDAVIRATLPERRRPPSRRRRARIASVRRRKVRESRRKPRGDRRVGSLPVPRVAARGSAQNFRNDKDFLSRFLTYAPMASPIGPTTLRCVPLWTVFVRFGILFRFRRIYNCFASP